MFPSWSRLVCVRASLFLFLLALILFSSHVAIQKQLGGRWLCPCFVQGGEANGQIGRAQSVESKILTLNGVLSGLSLTLKQTMFIWWLNIQQGGWNIK